MHHDTRHHVALKDNHPAKQKGPKDAHFSILTNGYEDGGHAGEIEHLVDPAAQRMVEEAGLKWPVEIKWHRYQDAFGSLEV